MLQTARVERSPVSDARAAAPLLHKSKREYRVRARFALPFDVPVQCNLQASNLPAAQTAARRARPRADARPNACADLSSFAKPLPPETPLRLHSPLHRQT